MKLNGLLELGERLPAFRELADSLATAGASVPAKPLGVHHAARPYLVAMLARALDRPLVVVTRAAVARANGWTICACGCPTSTPSISSPIPMLSPTNASRGRLRRANAGWKGW